MLFEGEARVASMVGRVRLRGRSGGVGSTIRQTGRQADRRTDRQSDERWSRKVLKEEKKDR